MIKDKQVAIGEFAAEAQRLLQQRQVLVERVKTLQSQVENAKANLKLSANEVRLPDEVVEPAYGPLKAVTVAQVDARSTWYPMPQELAESGERRNTCELPAFQVNHASKEEMSHLPPTFWQMSDSVGIPHTVSEFWRARM